METPAVNGRFTFGATSWWRNGGTNPTASSVLSANGGTEQRIE